MKMSRHRSIIILANVISLIFVILVIYVAGNSADRAEPYSLTKILFIFLLLIGLIYLLWYKIWPFSKQEVLGDKNK